MSSSVNHHDVFVPLFVRQGNAFPLLSELIWYKVDIENAQFKDDHFNYKFNNVFRSEDEVPRAMVQNWLSKANSLTSSGKGGNKVNK